MRRPSLSCQVEGCMADLSNLRPYFQRQHICEDHARADEIPDGHGGLLRFCQQCTKLEPLAAFDGTKRSCQASLVKRHYRRSGGGKRAYGGSTRSNSSGGYHGYHAGAAAAAAAALAQAATLQGAAEERSATSQQATGTTRSGSASRDQPADTAARSLAALVDAALPDAAAADAAAAFAPRPTLPILPAIDQPSVGTYDASGSGILGKRGPSPLGSIPMGHHPFASGPPSAATEAHASWAGMPADVQAAFLAAGVKQAGGGAAAGANNELLPLLASMLSARGSAEPASTSLGGRGGASLGAQPSGEVHQSSPLGGAQQAQQDEVDQRDLRQLLNALSLLQQLQQTISTVVVAQLQQHLARQEAASLLEQRLLPLLGSIQQQLAPRGDASSTSQLQQLLQSLNQLAGMLQPPATQQDQQALALLQWLQQAGALAGVAPAAAPTRAPIRPASGAVPGSENVQAMLHRVAGQLKRHEELA